MRLVPVLTAMSLTAAPLVGQVTTDPFPDPIPASEGVIQVNFIEFATVPDIDGTAARMMLLTDEPGTERIFVSDMRGPLYVVSRDGGSVSLYIDTNDPRWGYPVQSASRERGVQSFAFHPQFNQQGTPGYGKFYTYTDILDTVPAADFVPGQGSGNTHDTVLLEWTALNPTSGTYDGGAPREILRFESPYANHNGGHIAFNPTAAPGDADYGILYMGVADGGSGGDPLNLAQNPRSAFGKIFRIDPLGSNSANGKYGIPADNPFVGDSGVLDEIYALGVRNPQRFAWDPATGTLFLADIGQNTVEKISTVPAGGNLGWNVWEGSFRFVDREGVDLSNPRSDPTITYPVVEYGQEDPLLQRSSAATGVHIFRTNRIPALENLLLFGDMPSGEIFYIPADDLPDGGQAAIRRILFNDRGETKTLLQLIQEKNVEQGKDPATRTDMRFGAGPDGQLFIINKYDGVIRSLVP